MKNGLKFYIMNNRNFREEYTTLLDGNIASKRYSGICPIVFIKTDALFWMTPKISMVNNNSKKLNNEIDYKTVKALTKKRAVMALFWFILAY